jgi:hypothetical protein
MNSTQVHPCAQRPPARQPRLLTTTARVRAVELTPLGHVSCVLDTENDSLSALSDAVSVHLPELVVGRTLQVVLLSLHRASPDARWHWQLLCAREAPGEPVAQTVAAGSPQ